jgi:excisionase family DNA binding protein
MASQSLEARPQSLHDDSNAVEASEFVLNSTEVARILDRSPGDVTELARRGKIRARRMGTHWRFRNCDVLAYILRWVSGESTA